MKAFVEPELEIVEFDSEIRAGDLDESDDPPCSYACPSMYGDACQVNHQYNPSEPSDP